jgi:hypothetical protein
MKKKLLLITMHLLLGCGMTLLAQEPPHPGGDPSGTPGAGPVGGGAPVGSGFSILLVLGAAYGFKKIRENLKTT